MMITKAVISNYKGIKQCEIKDLRRVNLFIGKNASGKSSILEAIFHTCKEFVEGNLGNIMSRRTNVFTGGRELWYRYDTEPKIIISLSFEDATIKLRVETKGQQINTFLSASREAEPITPRLEKEVAGSIYMESDFSMNIGRGRGIDQLESLIPSETARADLARYLENAEFIDCSSKLDISNLETRLGQIKLDVKDEEFGSVLERIYGKGQEWEFLPHPDSPREKRIAVKEHGKRIFLSDFGDGFRYGSAICAAAMTTEGTGFFLEEIENHQHHGSLKQLVPSLVEISRKNDLQLFVSTHNYDTWNSFFYGAFQGNVKRRKKEFQNFIVERDPASGKVRAEPTDNIQRISEELGRR